MGTIRASETAMPDRFSVLVIDDDVLVLQAIDMALRATGWRVGMTTDPTRAIVRAFEINPDVIVCDASMPGFDGAERIKTLKSHPSTAAIPIVLMTGKGSESEYSALPFSAFLKKPFSPIELREIIERVAAKREGG